MRSCTTNRVLPLDSLYARVDTRDMKTAEATKVTEREFLIIQTTRWYVTASDKADAIGRVSDGLADLAGTEYKVREVRPDKSS